MSDETPPQDHKPTPSLMGAIPPWAAELWALVRRIDERLVGMDANIDLQKDTVRDVAKRMTDLEVRQVKLEERANNNSERAKGNAETNQKQDGEIAELKTMLADNNAKTDAIHEAVVGVIRDPRVRFVGRMLFLAAMAYAAAKGIKVLP